jgi:hypothetical protein
MCAEHVVDTNLGCLSMICIGSSLPALWISNNSVKHKMSRAKLPTQHLYYRELPLFCTTIYVISIFFIVSTSLSQIVINLCHLQLTQQGSVPFLADWQDIPYILVYGPKVLMLHSGLCAAPFAIHNSL